MSRYRFVSAHAALYGIQRLCRVLNVSRSGFYDWRRRGPSARAHTDAGLTGQVTAIHAASRGTYGSPRVHAELHHTHGVRVGRKRIERLMRAAGLVGAHRRRRRCLTRQDKQAPPAPDRLGRDVTYPPTGEGWLCLATVVDLATRKVIGYSIATHMRAGLVCEALRGAAGRIPLAGQAIFHSDAGSQGGLGGLRRGVRRARRGPVDGPGRVVLRGAVAESFFASLKTEIGTRVWATRAEARAAVFAWIEVHYNRRRRHSTPGYLTPAEAELHHREQPLAA